MHVDPLISLSGPSGLFLLFLLPSSLVPPNLVFLPPLPGKQHQSLPPVASPAVRNPRYESADLFLCELFCQIKFRKHLWKLSGQVASFSCPIPNIYPFKVALRRAGRGFIRASGIPAPPLTLFFFFLAVCVRRWLAATSFKGKFNNGSRRDSASGGFSFISASEDGGRAIISEVECTGTHRDGAQHGARGRTGGPRGLEKGHQKKMLGASCSRRL